MAWPATRVRPDGQENDPYPRLLYTGFASRGILIANFHWARLLFGRWDIWHLHWPEAIVTGNRPSWVQLPRLVLFWLLARLSRLKGTCIIWTAHNLRPHDSGHPRLEQWLFGILATNLAAVVCFSRSARALLLQEHRGMRHLPVYVVPHGNHCGCYPDVISRQEARHRLGIRSEDFVVLFIGQLRRYNNVVRLMESFRAAARPDWRLVVAGDPRDAGLEAEVAALASTCSQIIPESFA
jgi:beta-1,4-mannosyltransferase